VAAEITVEGRVQGVGFRAFVERHASRLGVTGYVMNLNEGRVHVHAEGERGAVETLIAEIRRGPRGSRVADAAVRWVDPTNRFRSFDIRYGGEADAG
jgi:acylphosphatase